MTDHIHAEFRERVMSGAWDRAAEGGGFIVPDAVWAEYRTYIDRPYWFGSFRSRTWEERLAVAIEERSIRGRLRRLTAEPRYRVATAIDVLRGTHYCGDQP